MMRNKIDRLCIVSVLFTAIFFIPEAFAVRFNGENTSAEQNIRSNLPAQMKFVEEQDPSVAPETEGTLQEERKTSGVITSDEIVSFIRDWPQYVQWLKASGNESKAVAYLGVSQSADYPAEVIKWLEKRNWTADRFFLLEQKFRGVISIQTQEAKIVSQISDLKKRIQMIGANTMLTVEQKQVMASKYSDNIKKLERNLEFDVPVTRQEYLLIKQNYGMLAKVLSE